MQFEVFINFDGNCREAIEFYAKVFKKEVCNLMTYGEAPPDPNYTVSETDKDRIMYAGIDFENMHAMFMDLPSNAPFIKGNNINPTLSMEDKEEVTRLFNELKEGGKVEMELQKAFFSELYGMVTDKFGISWQILHYINKA